MKNIIEQLTDPVSLMAEVKNTLQKLDPGYPEEEVPFLQAARELAEIPGGDEYLAAQEQMFISGLIYVGWLGFQWNLDCFQNPVNKLLNGDFEELHRESRMHTLPPAPQAQRSVDTFCQALGADYQYLTDGVLRYYAYLKTVAYKLAHYYGFLTANRFLPYVIPGYTPDGVLTDRYTLALRDYLKMNVYDFF